MLVTVPASLLDEHDLIYSCPLELEKGIPDLRGTAYAAGGSQLLRPVGLEVLPDVEPAGLMRAGGVVVAQSVSEELKSLKAAGDRRFAVFVAHEAGDHRDVGFTARPTGSHSRSNVS